MFRYLPVRSLPALLWLLAAVVPATAQEQAPEGDLSGLLETVTEAATAMAADMDAIQAALDASISGAADAEALLTKMVGAVDDVLLALAEDGAVWQQLIAALEVWEDRRQWALEQAAQQPEFEDIAAAWRERVEAAQELRRAISAQRSEAQATLDGIIERRELVLAYYELQRADEALAVLRAVNENLAVINVTMRDIVEQTEFVGAIAN